VRRKSSQRQKQCQLPPRFPAGPTSSVKGSMATGTQSDLPRLPLTRNPPRNHHPARPHGRIQPLTTLPRPALPLHGARCTTPGGKTSPPSRPCANASALSAQRATGGAGPKLARPIVHWPRGYRTKLDKPLEREGPINLLLRGGRLTTLPVPADSNVHVCSNHRPFSREPHVSLFLRS